MGFPPETTVTVRLGLFQRIPEVWLDEFFSFISIEREGRSVGAVPPCYLKYFLGGTPPTGLELDNVASLRTLCQTAPNNPALDFFATLFDDAAGIAIFSAYTINPTQGKGIHTCSRPITPWRTYPGKYNVRVILRYYQINNK